MIKKDELLCFQIFLQYRNIVMDNVTARCWQLDMIVSILFAWWRCVKMRCWQHFYKRNVTRHANFQFFCLAFGKRFHSKLVGCSRINVGNFGWPHPSHGFGPPELRKSWYHASRGTIWIGWGLVTKWLRTFAHNMNAMCARKLAQTKHFLLISSLLANLKGIERKKSA